MTEEILTNEVVEETATDVVEDIATADYGLTKVMIGVGATVIVGGLIYKFVVKPIIRKHKAKKEAEVEDITYDESIEQDFDEDSVEQND